MTLRTMLARACGRRSACLIVAAVIVSAVAGTPGARPVSAVPAPQAALPEAGSPRPLLDLPQSLTWSGEILHAVQTDIDDDGDLDLVATTVHDGVRVWINDGRGQLAPQAPIDQDAIGLKPLPPQVARDPGSSGDGIQSDEVPGFHPVPHVASSVALTPGDRTRPTDDVLVVRLFVSARTTRGPPTRHL